MPKIRYMPLFKRDYKKLLKNINPLSTLFFIVPLSIYYKMAIRSQSFATSTHSLADEYFSNSSGVNSTALWLSPAAG